MRLLCKGLGVVLLACVVACGGGGDSDGKSASQYAASSPTPAQGATGIALDVELGWSGPENVISYNVYFGTSVADVLAANGDSDLFLGNQTGATFSPEGLSKGTTYYWRVDTVHSKGESTGTVWAFTTVQPGAPDQVTDPSPADEAVDVELNMVLAWGVAQDATSYDVYLGTDAFEVAVATTQNASFQGNQVSTMFAPDHNFAEDEQHYWRVDARNDEGVARGEVWSFHATERGSAPFFGGLAGALSLGATTVHVFWKAATDDKDLSSEVIYNVYVSTTSGGHDFSSPSFTTQAGETAANLTSSDAAAIVAGATVYLVVRAVDTEGQEDTNAVEVSATLQSSSNQVFVDVAASSGGTGTFAAPFDVLQDGVDAIETAGGGTVLIAQGIYEEQVNLTVAGANTVMLVGGFPAFSTLSDASEATLLAAYDPSTHVTDLDGSNHSQVGDEGILDIDNDGRTTWIQGISITEAPDVALSALDSHVVVSDCRFSGDDSGNTPDAMVRIDTSDLMHTSSLVVLGSSFEFSDGGIVAGGLLSELRIENCSFQDIDGYVLEADTDQSLPSGGSMVVPTGGALSLEFSHNRVNRVEETLYLGFQAETPAMAGDLDLVIRDNEILYNYDGYPIYIEDLGYFGDGGAASLLLENNIIRGSYDTAVTFELVSASAVNPVPDGDITIAVRGNQLVGSDSDLIEIDDVNTAPGATTQIVVEDNVFGSAESRGIDMNGNTSGAADTNNGGTLDIQVRDNTFFAVDDAIDLDVGPSPDGHLNLVVENNAFGVNYGSLIELDLGWINGSTSGTAQATGYIEVTGNEGVSAGSVGFEANVASYGGETRLVVAANMFGAADDDALTLSLDEYSDDASELDVLIFGNLLNDVYDLGLDISNNMDEDDELNLYVANNSAIGGFESEAVEITTHVQTLGLIANNEAGLNDVDSSDAFDLYPSGDSLGSIMVRNNIFAGSAGDGVEAGGWAQFVNNTVVRNSQYGDDGGIYGEGDNGFSNVFVMNSIVWGNGGDNLYQSPLLRATYSLLERADEAIGHMNVVGAPVFARAGDVREFGSYYGLSSGSPGVNSGNLSSHYNDADGSRNDIGALGGPGGNQGVGWLGQQSELPLEVIGLRPFAQLYDGARPLGTGDSIEVVLTRDVLGSSVTSSTVRVTDGTGAAVAGTRTSSGARVIFAPTSALTEGGFYVVTVDGLAAADGPAQQVPFYQEVAVNRAAVAETEPNDTTMAATDTIGTDTVFRFTGSVADGSGDDEDYYVVNAVAGDRLKATVFADRESVSGGDFEMTLYASDGSTVLHQNDGGFGDDPYLDHVFASSGVYYLGITENNGTGAEAYDLTGTLRAP